MLTRVVIYLRAANATVGCQLVSIVTVAVSCVF